MCVFVCVCDETCADAHCSTALASQRPMALQRTAANAANRRRLQITSIGNAPSGSKPPTIDCAAILLPPTAANVDGR